MGVFITRPPNLFQFPSQSPNLPKDVWNTINCICWRNTTIIISSWSSFPDTYCWCKVVRCEVRYFFRQTSSNYRTFNSCEVFLLFPSNISWPARTDTSIHNVQVHEAMPRMEGGQ